MSAKKTTIESSPAKKTTAKKKESTKKAAAAVAAKQPDNKVTAETPVTAKSAKPKKAAVKPTASQSTAKKATEKPTSPKPSATKKDADKSTAAKSKTTQENEAKEQKTATDHITTVIAKLDVGYGNNLYIRGEGAELNWEKGILMENTGSDEWSWSTGLAVGEITFKFLINDEIWSTGGNFTVAAGDTSISSPTFS